MKISHGVGHIYKWLLLEQMESPETGDKYHDDRVSDLQDLT
jgi:hypothetical protein